MHTVTARLVVVAALHRLEAQRCIIHRYEWISACRRLGKGSIVAQPFMARAEFSFLEKMLPRTGGESENGQRC